MAEVRDHSSPQVLAYESRARARGWGLMVWRGGCVAGCVVWLAVGVGFGGVCRELGDCAGPEWVDVLFSVVVGGIAASPVFGVALLGRRLKGCVMSKAGAQHAVGGKKPSRWMIGIFALGYFLVSLVLLVFLIGMGMAEFDSPDPPSLVLRLAGVAMLVELLPLVTPVLLLHIHLPIVAQWLVFFGNSLLWGWGAWYLLGRFQRRRTAAWQRRESGRA